MQHVRNSNFTNFARFMLIATFSTDFMKLNHFITPSSIINTYILLRISFIMCCLATKLNQIQIETILIQP